MSIVLPCADVGDSPTLAADPWATEFEDAVRTFKRSVTLAAYRITGNVEDARDIAQYTFMQLYRRGPRFADRRSIERWLYVVSRNAALSVYRARERDAGAAAAVGCAATDEFPNDLEDTIVRNELAAAVRAVIASLPPEQRDVIELRHLAAMPAAEVASTLGIPLKRVKHEVERARMRLRVELERRGLHDDVR
jgi:RNA polymerase sigma-70 factor (ECF subfamily)